MSSLNLSTNGPSITKSYQSVLNAPPPSGPAASSPTYGQWSVFAVAAPLVSAFQHEGGKESVMKVQSTGGTFGFIYGGGVGWDEHVR
jgi:drebrin-like protein